MSPVVLLVLLVLSPSIHASSARILGVEAKYSNVSGEGFGVAKLNENSVPLMAAVPSPRGMVPSEKQITRDDEGKTPRVLSAGAAQDPSLVKVSNWRVRTMEDPRFDVDYVGPRTHPPSHN